MSDSNKDQEERSKYLKIGILLSMAWVMVVYFMISELQDSEGIIHVVYSIEEGDYLPVILVAASVILLAYALKSFVTYFNFYKRDQ